MTQEIISVLTMDSGEMSSITRVTGGRLAEVSMVI